jgi:hypothetical protein
MMILERGVMSVDSSSAGLASRTAKAARRIQLDSAMPPLPW